MTNKREAKKKQKYMDFLTTAKKLFQLKGIEHTAMHEISTHAGYGAKTLHRYFQSRNSLILALLEDEERLSLQRVDLRMKKLSQNAVDRVCDIFSAYADYDDVLANLSIWREYESVRISEYNNNLIREDVADLRSGIVSVFRTILEKSKGDRLLEEGTNIDEMAEVIHSVALLNYHKALRGSFNTKVEAEVAFKTSIAFILSPYSIDS